MIQWMQKGDGEWNETSSMDKRLNFNFQLFLCSLIIVGSKSIALHVPLMQRNDHKGVKLGETGG